MRIYAIVKEKDTEVYVTTLTDKEFEEAGDIGVEELVQAWCLRRKLTFVDYTH